jgi:HK97 family phage major capsid protein
MAGPVTTALEARRVQREAELESRSAAQRGDRELAAAEWDMAANGIGGARLTADQFRSAVEARKDAEFRSFLENGSIPMGAAYVGSLAYAEQRDQGIGAGSAGGYMVPARMQEFLVKAERMYGPMLRLANIVDTPDGRPLSRPGIDDTAVSGAIQAENVVLGAGTDWVVSNNTALLAYQYVTLPLRVSVQLDTDVAPGANGGFSLEEQIGDQLGRRIARKLNADMTVGTGTSMPAGLFDATVGASVGVTLATGNTVSFATGVSGFNALRALRDSVNAAYWPGAVWVCNTATASAIQGMLDSNNRPYFDPNKPCSPFGFPIEVNDDVVAQSANALFLGFGNVSRAYTGRMTPQAVHRLGERWADQLQVGFFLSTRFDGRLSGDGGAFKLLKASAT